MVRMIISMIVLFVMLTTGVRSAWAQKVAEAAEAVVISPELTQNRMQEYTFGEEQFKEVQEFEVEISLPEPEGTEPVLDQESPYVLGVDDVIKIEVMRHPEFTGDYVVGPDGNIQYTFVGDVRAAGLTKYELQAMLKERLLKYVRVPDVSVSIAEYHSNNVYVLGEVARPGKYSMRGNSITLREAVIQAGLPTEFAQIKSIKVVRPVKDSRPIVQKINMKNVLYKGKLGGNIDLQSGDIVVVNPTAFHKVVSFLNRLTSPFSSVRRVVSPID